MSDFIQKRMMMNEKIAIVIPSNREENLQEMLKAWNFSLERLLIVRDNETTYKAIKQALGKDSWIIPHHSDCIRSFGFWNAYYTDAEIIITLDDDCFLPEHTKVEEFLKVHTVNLCEKNQSKWESTIEGVKPRGVPFDNIYLESGTQYLISHGLWTNFPDLDAITQLTNSSEAILCNKIIPVGKYFPMCGMNLAFRREALPMMYFLLMGKEYPFDRFGDIWC